MRTFISIDIPQEVQKEIKKIQEQLPEFFGKKTELENLHLTLKFLGEISEEKIHQIKEKLKEINFQNFEVKIDSLGVFSESFIRIVWLHIGGCGQLQKQIDENLSDFFEKEKRFMSHLTIARVKGVKGRREEFLEKINKIKFSELKFSVSEFKLKKSELKPEGPVYEDIGVYSLK